MRKFFLIPVLALFTCVSAWAIEVTTKEALQTALNAGGEITLGADINLGASQVTMTSGTVVLDLNGNNLTSTLANYGTDKGALNVSGGNLTINATNGGGIRNNGSSGCAIVVGDGAKLTVNGGTFFGFEAIYTKGGEIIVNDGVFTTGATADNCIWLAENDDNPSKALIKGGNFTGGWMCFQVDATSELKIENITAASSGNAGCAIIYNAGNTTIEITGGSFKGENPAQYVVFEEALMTYDSSTDTYTVSKEVSGVAYNLDNFTTGESLQDVVDAASNGNHILVLASGQSATVGKNLTFELGANAATINAASGYQKSVNGDFVSIMADGSLGAYLNGDSETPYVVSANTDLRTQGLVKVKGNKKVTINSGVTVTTAYKTKYPHFRVPNGAKLTIEGDGTIIGDRGQFIVYKGGELVIGKSDKSDQLHITTSYNNVVNLVVKNYGKTTINNAEIHAASAVAQSWGTMEILGGLYTGEASTASMHKYCITADNGSQMTLKNSTVKGVHGAVCVQGLDASQKGGNIRIEDCELIATDTPNGTKINGLVHYALYSATGGIASVYRTKMKSTTQPRAIHIGNNDAYNTFGLVYLYEGCKVKCDISHKNDKGVYDGWRINVQKRSATDKEVLFPISVDENSAWYTAAMNGGEGPLPSGYNWVAIDEDGYTWEVVSTAEKESDAAGTTIPWQQNTTWTDTETPKVPDQNTAVTIPEGKTVVVDKDQANKEAKAEQITIAGEGASLTVQDGTTLNVENGMNIADGGKLVVDAGARVTVGAGGVVAANDDAVEIKTAEGKSGIFMIAPTVTENTHPMAKVELKSKAYKRGENDYVWQRFGLPGYMTGVTRADMEYDHVTYPTSVKKVVNQNWANMENDDEFVPFKCYALTTNNPVAGAVYTFTCPLMGNGNAELELTDNWNYYANSYTAPITISQMISDFATNYPSVSATVYLYDPETDWWFEINNATQYLHPTWPKTIEPMQAFIFQRMASGDNPVINYQNQIWDPIMTPPASPAPAREQVAPFGTALIEITAADGSKDNVSLVAGNQFSSAFDNAYDATKYMNDASFNLFADANNEKMSIIATDNLEGTTLSMTTKEQTSFTMAISNVNAMDYAIRDNLTGTVIELVEGATYMFSTQANANVEGRFEIIPVAKMPTAIDNIEETAAVKGIYTVTGQFVGNNYHALPAGVYVVDGKKIVK
ncbi:MAG: G8 domain-containing protein [Paludibacteraceae bacterium]|nr:G8 domain-containing protein [Paludibacteraceae bacterium]